MKNILVVAFLLISSVAWSQEIRLNAYGGYVFKDGVDSYYSSTRYFDGTIQDGFRWGAGIEFHIPNRGALEIQYLRHDTNAPTTYIGGTFNELQFTDFDLDINWIMVNGTRYFPVSDIMEPFIGAGAGMGIFSLRNPDNGREDSATKFAWQIRGGTNVWLAERVAFRVELSLLSAVQAMGGGFYFGTGGGGAGISSYSTMYQFGIGGGLSFRLRE